MGGQACVLYGAAEFSRDTDIAVLAAAVALFVILLVCVLTGLFQLPGIVTYD